MDRYDTYKDSGVSWLGNIPKHWKVSKVKHILFHKKKTSNPELNCGSISFG
jgi:type I restriction enzyme S subunit